LRKKTIQHAGISQGIQISQFRFRSDKGHNFCYILCNFGENRFTNPRDYAGSFCTFWNETANIDNYYTKYLSKYWTKLHQLLALVGLCMQIIKLK